MIFTLKINCNNAAFTGRVPNEIARIIKQAALTVEREEGSSGNLRDAYGNTVGQWQIKGKRNRDNERRGWLDRDRGDDDSVEYADPRDEQDERRKGDL